MFMMFKEQQRIGTKNGWAQWLMTVISATWEVLIGRIVV
jgi:hypothetical protein